MLASGSEHRPDLGRRGVSPQPFYWALAGAGLVGAAVFALVIGDAWLAGHALSSRLLRVAWMLAIASGVAGMAAWFLAETFPRRTRLGRAALLAGCLVLILPAAAALSFAVVYRAHFAVTHEPVLSREGLHELVWTGVAGLFHFSAMGPAYLWPAWPLTVALGAALYASAPR